MPFIGTFVVTAAWGNATGANHATPAIDFKMPIGTPIYATAAGNVDYVGGGNLAGFVNSFDIGIVSPYLAYPGWGGKIDSDGDYLIRGEQQWQQQA